MHNQVPLFLIFLLFILHQSYSERSEKETWHFPLGHPKTWQLVCWQERHCKKKEREKITFLTYLLSWTKWWNPLPMLCISVMMEEILPNIQTTKTVSKFSIILTYTASPSFCCPTSEKNNFTIFFTIFTLFSTSLWSIQQTFRDNKIFFFFTVAYFGMWCK